MSAELLSSWVAASLSAGPDMNGVVQISDLMGHPALKSPAGTSEKPGSGLSPLLLPVGSLESREDNMGKAVLWSPSSTYCPVFSLLF